MRFPFNRTGLPDWPVCKWNRSVLGTGSKQTGPTVRGEPDSSASSIPQCTHSVGVASRMSAKKKLVRHN